MDVNPKSDSYVFTINKRNGLVFVVISFFIAILIYGLKKETSPPPEMVVGKDVISNEIDAYLDSLLEVSEGKPLDDNKNFGKLVDQINLRMLDLYATKVDLSNKQRRMLKEEYFDRRTNIISDINQTIIEKKSYLDKKDVKYKYYNAANDFSESMSGFVCSVTSFSYLAVLNKINKNNLASFFAIKPSCKFILAKGLLPITSYLRDEAIIRDIEVVKFDLSERIRASILKLATAKDTYYYTTSKEKKITYNLYFTTTTQVSRITASTEATVTAGFDLNNFSMEVDHRRKELIIKLPQPHVLSNEVSLSYHDPDEDVFSPSVKSGDYTTLSYLAKRQSLQYAANGDLFLKAKNNANKAVSNIFQSIMELPQFNYKVRVEFDGDVGYFDVDSRLE